MTKANEMKMEFMDVKFSLPFICDEGIRPHLEKIFSGGEYELPITFQGGYKILDLGANCGAFALWAIHRWPGSQVTCYEPHPGIFAALTENTKDYPEIKCHNYGIGKPGIRVLFDGPNNSGERSFNKTLNNMTPTGAHAEVKSPLELPDADILKLDIEGCELEVIEDLTKAKRSFNFILIEYHNHFIRREIDRLLIDYHLIGGEVTSPFGIGIAKYANKKVWDTP